MRILLLLSILSATLCRAADTIAVLPLFNLDAARSPNLNWIGESVAETVYEALRGANLLVLSREDREEVYRRLSVRAGVVLTKASVIKIAAALDAGRVVYGEFRVDAPPGSTPAMNAGLSLRLHTLDVKRLHPGQNLEQTGVLSDLSRMETRLAWLMLRNAAGEPGLPQPALVPAASPPVSEEEFLRERPAVRVNAMETYIRGLMAVDPGQRAKLFTQSAKLDQNFSQPRFQLGRLEFAKRNYKAAGEWLSKVARTDSHYMEASFLLGICRIYAGDDDAAIALFRMVAAELPLNEVYNNLGVALLRKNDSGAVAGFQKAIEGDAGDPDYLFNAGYALWKYGQFSEAADRFRAVLQRTPGDPEATSMLGRCLKQEGPQPGDSRNEGGGRIKTVFEDSAFRQLQAELRKVPAKQH